ncbi:Bro-N domain-containing protein [Patescibacteria group bacterium]|nr:Bro-N domain-containing protein [Patescibacteria group bacterium]
MTDELNKIIPIEGECEVNVFRKKEIRKVLHKKEWWFSVKDCLEVLTDTTDGNRYSRDLRKKDKELALGWAEITRTLDFGTSAGGKQATTFIGIEGLFRLMQSVPTKKAEPFKKWLARVGFERLREIQNPELAVKRAITLYRAKGYDDGWIDARIRNKVSREILTAEWDRRGVTQYIGLLTDAISIKTFGIPTNRHKIIKGLKGQSLRDNMTPIELTLTTLGEQATTEIAKSTDSHGLKENMKAAERGGEIAGSARKQIENSTGKKVVSAENYLTKMQRENNKKQLGVDLDTMFQKYLKSI